MSEAYRCPLCQAVFSAEEARTALYRCPACRERKAPTPAYLVAHREPIGPVLAIRAPAAVNVQAGDGEANHALQQGEAEADASGNGRSMLDLFEAALARRRALAESATLHSMRFLPSSGSPSPNEQVGDASVHIGADAPPGDSSTYPSSGSAPSGNGSVCVVAVLPPPKNEIDAAAMEQLLGTLEDLPSPVALEIAGEHQRRWLTMRGAPDVVARLEAQLYSVYEQVDVQPLPADQDSARAITASERVLVTAHLHQRNPEFLPLKTWREFEGNDPLRPLLGAFGTVREGEHLLAQLVIHREAPAEWARPHLQQLAALKRRGYGAEAPMPTKNIVGGMIGFVLILAAGVLLLWAQTLHDWRTWAAMLVSMGLGALAITLVTLARSPWAETLDEDATLKLRDKAFVCELRLFASAATEDRAKRLLDQLIAAYKSFNTTSGNQLRVSRKYKPHPRDLSLARLAPTMLLNVKELAGFWHMPVGPSLELVRRTTYERVLPLPEDVTYPDGAFIGVSRKGPQAVRVQLSPEALQGNMLFVGKTQHGKSTLMAHIARRWMQDPDRSVVIVDPHGDLARQMIGLFPPERLGDVLYIDLSDNTRSVGLNLIDVSDGSQPHEVAETFMDVGKALWEDYWGPRMSIPLQFGLRALACANQKRPPERQYTILSLVPLLTCDDEVRESFLKEEVSLRDQAGLHQYFLSQFNLETKPQREQVISPVLSKAHAFERSPAILRLVGQPRSTLRLFDAIRSRKIVIVNTSAGMLGEDLAGFAGSLILNIMRRVIALQAALPREERVRVSVIADEFQTMTGVDFGALLGELQKYGGNFVLGTQSLHSLTKIDETGALAGRIFAGVTTKAAFQVNGDDAGYLAARELDSDRLDPESLTSLPKYCAYLKTVNESGRPIPAYLVEIADVPEADPRLKAAVRARQVAYTVPADEADRLARESLLRFSEEYGLLDAEGRPVVRRRKAADEDLGMEQVDTKPVGERDAQPAGSGYPGAPVESEAQREQQSREKAMLPPWAVGHPPATPAAALGTALQQVLDEQANRQDDGTTT